MALSGCGTSSASRIRIGTKRWRARGSKLDDEKKDADENLIAEPSKRKLNPKEKAGGHG